MKKVLLLIALLFYTSCTTSYTSSKLASNSNSLGGSGGNPEARLHKCLLIKESVEQKVCLEAIYPYSDTIKIYLAQAPIAQYTIGRGDIDNEKRVFDFSNKEYKEFIIHIDITEVKQPISCNIKGANIYQTKSKATINIPVKNIIDKVIIYNREHKILDEYQIIKK